MINVSSLSLPTSQNAFSREYVDAVLSVTIQTNTCEKYFLIWGLRVSLLLGFKAPSQFCCIQKPSKYL